MKSGNSTKISFYAVFEALKSYLPSQFMQLSGVCYTFYARREDILGQWNTTRRNRTKGNGVSLFLSLQVYEMFYFLCFLANSSLFLSAQRRDQEEIEPRRLYRHCVQDVKQWMLLARICIPRSEAATVRSAQNRVWNSSLRSSSNRPYSWSVRFFSVTPSDRR